MKRIKDCLSYKKKKERKKRRGGGICVPFISHYPHCYVDSFTSCSRRTVNSWLLFPMQYQAWPQSRWSGNCSALCQIGCRYVRQSWLVPGRESKNSLLGCSLRVGQLSLLACTFTAETATFLHYSEGGKNHVR